MNQKQIMMRDFIEHIVLDGFSYEDFKFLQGEISESVFSGGDYVDLFCRYFDLGDGFVDQLDLIEFPFLLWWNDFCKEFEQESELSAREEFERLDDYYRAAGVK